MDIEKDIKNLADNYNNQPVVDFTGFTPFQMHQIIHFPFSADCPIKLNHDIQLSQIQSSPIFNISYSLLEKISESGKIKLTARGNLPGKTLRAIYDERLFLDPMIENGITKLTTETDWIILHTIHIILKLSGLARKNYGYLLLTKKGKKYFFEGNESSLFMNLLETYSMKYNWEYNDAYEIESIGQVGFLYLLFLINKLGSKYEDMTLYSDHYFRAFPVFLERYISDDSFRRRIPNNALSVRFFERFSYWFGFIKYQGDVKSTIVNENIKIKKTQLLKSLII